MECNFFQDPMISKMMIASSQLGCSEEIITIAAVLSVQVKLFALVMTNFFGGKYPINQWFDINFQAEVPYEMKSIWKRHKNIVEHQCLWLSSWSQFSNYPCMQSIWIAGRGIQKESDEAKLRFAAAEVL